MTPIAITSAVLLSIKITALFGLLIYAIFAAVIVRQEQLMAHVLEEAFEPIIRVLVIIHLSAALALFIFALITL